MKKMNLLTMSLVSAAALSFSSCSNNDDLGGGAGTQSQVDGFYMTLAIQTPTNNGTRTVEGTDGTKTASTEEQTVTKGTFFLVDQNGYVAFSRNVDSSSKNEDEKWNGATESQTGTKLINIKVDKVAAGTTYKVYFLAGDNQVPANTNPTTYVFEATSKFANPFATANNFAMFNQNDANVDGNGYTVVFTKDNKDKANPATVKYTKGSVVKEKAPIAIERITARIDAPTSGVTNITATYSGEKELTEPVKEAMKDARNKVKGITLSRYAIVNLTNKANVMQTWSNSALSIPSGITMWQPTTSFGGEKLFADGGFTTVAATAHNYVFENTSTDPTKMYFEYKVTLDETKFKNKAGEVMPADFTDGTFYRYNNIIFTSFAQIFNQYADVTDIFGTGKDAVAMKNELKAILDKSAGAERETALENFRKTYDIEVFDKGLTYYRQNIVDKNLVTTGLPLIQRNTIYQLTVNNVFNIGAQVPNGEDEIDKKSLFYLNVTVSVNPWVLNTQGVELGD
uniref:fimbria major subunit n=1 Tax=Segatella copri TaxID=165179 RepID=UPI0025E97D11